MPTLRLVKAPDATWVWECSGLGVTVRHQQRAMAALQWHCQATARGYDGPAPQIKP